MTSAIISLGDLYIISNVHKILFFRLNIIMVKKNGSEFELDRGSKVLLSDHNSENDGHV